MSDSNPGTGHEILIVEDEQIVALDLRLHLERLGYRVGGVFASAERLIAALTERSESGSQPDLVLMDIHLQGEMDGVAAAAIVRDTFGLPVILVTAYADEETLDRAKVSEPFAYIIKPFDDRELRTAVVLALYRNEMERAVVAREALLSGVLGSIESGVLVSDPDGAISFANGVAWSILHAEGAGDIADYIPGDIRAQALDSEVPIRWSPEHYDGGVVEISARVLNLPPRSRNGPLTVWVLRDISERLRSEAILRKQDAQLSHAQRMEAIGRMSGGLAHDFNNLVTVIMGHTRLVLDDIDEQPETEEIRKNMEGILATARRSAVLTRQLLAFSRSQQIRAEILEPDRLLGQQQVMIKGLIPEYVDFTLERHAPEARILMDPNRFEQMVLNLLLNARDAVSDGGTVSLSTETIETQQPLATLTRTIPPGQYVVLCVSDTGDGIDSELLPHVFEPFFTTKDSDRGSGFGLATVYSAIDEVDGAVDITSTLGRGTTFSVYLPMEPQGHVEDAPADRAEHLPRGSGTVLVVQDEDAVRSLISEVLRNAGFSPILARSVGDGLLILEQNRETAAVISDLSAPYLSAVEIVDRYREVLPVPVVLVLAGDRVEGGQSATVIKPFEPGDLLTALTGVLEPT